MAMMMVRPSVTVMLRVVVMLKLPEGRTSTLLVYVRVTLAGMMLLARSVVVMQPRRSRMGNVMSVRSMLLLI